MTNDDAFGHWLAGFIDGEGSFGISKAVSRPAYQCTFVLALRADDEAIIQEIAKRLHIGYVARSSRRPPTHPTVLWTVRSKAHCLALVAYLEQYPLRAKKSADFAIWRQAVRLWATRSRKARQSYRYVYYKSDWEEMARLKKALETVRSFRGVAESSPAKKTPQLQLLPGGS